MDAQYKNSLGVESGATTNGREVAVANKRTMRGSDLVLRFLALALCLSATIVLGVDRQSTTVALTLVPTLPPVTIPVTAKYHYLSAFVYFVVANAIACTYAALSLLLALANRSGTKKTLSMLIVIFDLVITVLLFSSIGASLSIGLMGYNGNSHVQWRKVCDVFGKFCNQVAVAVGLSGVASLLFFLLVVLAIFNLHKKH